jgi:N-hydroxyarylamine O-acetyltransferase
MSLLKAYCDRLNISIDDYSMSLDFLNQLHLKHCFTIPFENLSIMLGKFPSLEKEDLRHKILVKNHGGYCFELNGLLYELLKELGFEVYCLCARILFGSVRVSYRSHQILLVRLEGQNYILDVGYRSGILIPLPLIFNKAFEQHSECFRFLEKPNNQGFQNEVVLQKKILGTWEDLYSFYLTPYEPIDFKPLNLCTATLPNSTFTSKRIVSLKTVTGSKSLLDNILVELKNGVKSEKKIQTSGANAKILADEFGIIITQEESDILFSYG